MLGRLKVKDLMTGKIIVRRLKLTSGQRFGGSGIQISKATRPYSSNFVRPSGDWAVAKICCILHAVRCLAFISNFNPRSTLSRISMRQRFQDIIG